MNKECLKWIMPSMKTRSVESSSFRCEKAEEQADIAADMIQRGVLPTREDITKYVNEFFSNIGMENVTPKEEKTKYIYRDIWKKYKPKDMAEKDDQKGMVEKDDIVWIKFTKNGVVGVIGTSCDVFLGFPNCYGKYSTSDKIVYHVWNKKGKDDSWSWDTKNVLIFPLCNIPDGLNRSDTESGIGNYLISKGVPILDFYSHNY